MMDELQRLSRPWPTSGRPSVPSVSETTGERLLTLELTQGYHTEQLGELKEEVARLRDAQRAKAEAEATAEKVRHEIREARKNAMAVMALMISAAMLAIALTRFAVDSRPPASPVSATTVPGRG